MSESQWTHLPGHRRQHRHRQGDRPRPGGPRRAGGDRRAVGGEEPRGDPGDRRRHRQHRPRLRPARPRRPGLGPRRRGDRARRGRAPARAHQQRRSRREAGDHRERLRAWRSAPTTSAPSCSPSLLRDHIVASGPGRIVNVASTAHYQAKGIDWDAVRRPSVTRTALREYAVSKARQRAARPRAWAAGWRAPASRPTPCTRARSPPTCGARCRPVCVR
ncbi:hypothetical protein [Nocardioides convexus]|uniref:hypothetical protein n=1 Tax=Nocardioides convexus TaxID=2712224 RepID=UPI0024184C9E|nr:hypothetical protein [Nocardioides convexus]